MFLIAFSNGDRANDVYMSGWCIHVGNPHLKQYLFPREQNLKAVHCLYWEKNGSSKPPVFPKCFVIACVCRDWSHTYSMSPNLLPGSICAVFMVLYWGSSWTIMVLISFLFSYSTQTAALAATDTVPPVCSYILYPAYKYLCSLSSFCLISSHPFSSWINVSPSL